MGLLCGGGDLAVDKDLIQDIKNNVNIVDVIGEVVSLTKSGHNYLGLCPFHKEKTPSFNVVEDKQFFHINYAYQKNSILSESEKNYLEILKTLK